MRRSPFAALIVLTSIVTIAATDACTTQQAKSADAVAVDLTGAVCAVGEAQPAGQPWVDVVCTVAEGVESGISIATAAATTSSEAGAAPPAPVALASTKVVHLHMTKDQAALFVGQHAGSGK